MKKSAHSSTIAQTSGGRLNPSFTCLNASQFLGSLNDNLFKLMAVFFGVHLLGKEKSDWLSNTGSLVFAIPFILFLPAAGVLADRVSKRNVAFWSKVLEIVVMVLGALAFMQSRIEPLFAVLFLLATQAAIFGPSKYGMIPELVQPHQLSRANGWLHGFTYLAIITGTASAGVLERIFQGHFALAATVCVAFAVAGTVLAWHIEKTPVRNPTARASFFFYMDAWRTIRLIRHDHHLLLAIFGAAFFSFIGAFLINTIIPYGIKQLGLSEIKAGLLCLAAALGVGAGSITAGKLSGRNIEFGIVPLGALLVGLAAAGTGLFTPGPAWTAVWLVVAGLGSGLFIVPIEAFIQWRSPKDRIGEVVATTNWLGWVGVLGASGFGLLLAALHADPSDGFVTLGLLTMVLTVATVKVLPDFLVRFVTMIITRTIYRIRVLGVENLPVEGPALLVSNHVSTMDAVQILAVQQRRIRFLMHRPIYERSRMKPLFKLMGVIPISMDDPPRRIVEALQAARKALDEGYLVCIFAEGALTRTGMMHDFKRGFERIVKGTDYPIVPVYIGGTWGSIFSHYYDPTAAKIPREIPYPCTILFGRPMPATAKAHEVRQAVMELSTEYFEDRKPLHRSLAREWIRIARRNWSRHAMSDTTGRRLTYGRALIGSLVLAREIGRLTKDQQNVGVLLPPTCGGALVNLALALLRKTSVNLNFTASAEAFQYAIQRPDIRTIISSGAFLEKLPDLANLPGIVKLEELAGRIGAGAKLRAAVAARCLPVTWVAHDLHGDPDDVATIIFSSGTTGEPKGVMLSQHNIIANIESLSMSFRPRQSYDIAATLPLFHSFGYTCGIWFPLLTGMSASYHVSPLDGGRIAQMIRENKCTALFATPTFLLAYIRKAKAEDFKSLLYVITGAEKLKPRIAEAFQERFGIAPLEGYGTTELSPVAALSIPDVNVDGVYQSGRKAGTVGQPVPGVAVRIVDPDTNELLPPRQPGLLLIKGPNVMLGYLGKPELTAQVIHDGWYNTGDIAQVDDEGFITITDRLARFSKIGGEMVPHGAIEEEFQRGLGKHETVLAVASVPDEKRGERLVVLYMDHACDPAKLVEIMEKSPIPNLWKPAKNAYFSIEALPMTGTGKLDVKTLRKMAQAAHDAAEARAQPAEAKSAVP